MQDSVDMGLQLIRVVGSLALVLILLMAGLYGLKRWGLWMKKSTSNAWIQVMAQHSFGQRHHLMVVRVREEMFLLGVSPQGMHCLSSLSESPGNTPANPHDPGVTTKDASDTLTGGQIRSENRL